MDMNITIDLTTLGLLHEQEDTLHEYLYRALIEQAARHFVSPMQMRYRQMRFTFAHTYDAACAHEIAAMSWGDGHGYVRRMHRVIDDLDARYSEPRKYALCFKEMIMQLNMRSELFTLKLMQKFPKNLDRVECDGQGKLKAYFKNGHFAAGNEADIQSPDFMAACAMVYDL